MTEFLHSDSDEEKQHRETRQNEQMDFSHLLDNARDRIELLHQFMLEVANRILDYV